MSMDKSIVGYIVSSLETWRENEKVGEEVRALKNAITNHLINDMDTVLEAIYNIIEENDEDLELGKAIRKVYIPLKVYYEDKTVTL